MGARDRGSRRGIDALGQPGSHCPNQCRRLLAYSAIGHAGYILIALVVRSRQSLVAMVYYVITYALATVGAFGVLAALESEKVDTIADFTAWVNMLPRTWRFAC